MFASQSATMFDTMFGYRYKSVFVKRKNMEKMRYGSFEIMFFSWVLLCDSGIVDLFSEKMIGSLVKSITGSSPAKCQKHQKNII
ncbi:hypothetical protein Hanom_Chr01g00072981 [Helianthus anomalus]